MKVASMFSGVGGVELGFHSAGLDTELFCEIDPAAQNVLRERFPAVPIHNDITTLKRLPCVDVLAAGFPCQDLSQAGRKGGISGANSGLVNHVFRLVRAAGRKKVRWIVLENVAYMLRLGRGQAMRHLIAEIEELGYSWAYRVVDIRSFGLPQRRQRVVIVASRSENPCNVLFADNEGTAEVEPRPSETKEGSIYGFYWTEGSRGVGWAIEATPPIKGGSSIGIPSPPAVWRPRNDFVGTIHLEDAERLQGFAPGWTSTTSKSEASRDRFRWRLVGNAVCVPMAQWIGHRLMAPGQFSGKPQIWMGSGLPIAAWGGKGKFNAADVSKWPLRRGRQQLSRFLHRDLKPLSARATEGFLGRAGVCTNVVYSSRFLASLRTHADKMRQIENRS